MTFHANLQSLVAWFELGGGFRACPLNITPQDLTCAEGDICGPPKRKKGARGALQKALLHLFWEPGKRYSANQVACLDLALHVLFLLTSLLETKGERYFLGQGSQARFSFWGPKFGSP